jgi:hypothetical protein
VAKKMVQELGASSGTLSEEALGTAITASEDLHVFEVTRVGPDRDKEHRSRELGERKGTRMREGKSLKMKGLGMLKSGGNI